MNNCVKFNAQFFALPHSYCAFTKRKHKEEDDDEEEEK